MITNENFTYAIKNLQKRKLRSFLTVLSIFVGITTIFIFISFGVGLTKYIDEISEDIGIDKLIIQARGIGAPGTDSGFRLEDSDLRVIERTRGIKNAVGVPFAAGQIESDGVTKYSYLVGVPVDDKEDLDLAISLFTVDIETGRMLDKGDDKRVVLGHLYQQANGVFPKALDVGDKIVVNDERLTIIGFFKKLGNPADDANIYVTLPAYRSLTGQEDINYGIITAVVDDVSRIDEISDRVKKEMRKARGQQEGKEDFYVQTAQQLIDSFSGALNIVIGFIFLIAIISVVVSAVNTANTMFTSILERTKEIGVLKAIGAQNKEILVIFLLESSILGFIAGIIGITLGYILSVIGGVILDNLGWGFLQPYFPAELFIGCIVFATIVGTISGIIPAINASHQHPVDSLRYE